MSIRKQRERANISQVDLAKRVGVTQGMVSQWENEEFSPRVNKLVDIANALGCTVDDLLKKEK